MIILSTAVTRPGSFVGDAQRLNVALTRAKHHLILVRAVHLLLLAGCRIIAPSDTDLPAKWARAAEACCWLQGWCSCREALRLESTPWQGNCEEYSWQQERLLKDCVWCADGPCASLAGELCGLQEPPQACQIYARSISDCSDILRLAYVVNTLASRCL